MPLLSDSHFGQALLDFEIVLALLALVRKVPIGKGNEGLVESADKAVRVLAAKAGYTLAPPVHKGGGDSSTATIVIAIAAVVVVALVAGVEILRRRRKRASALPEGVQPS